MIVPPNDQKLPPLSSDVKSGIPIDPPEYSESDRPHPTLNPSPPFPQPQHTPMALPPTSAMSPAGAPLPHAQSSLAPTYGRLPGGATLSDTASTSRGSSRSGRSGHGQSRGGKIVKAVGSGMLALVATPVIVSATLLYGSGKLVEGIGKGISAGPELLLKAYKGKKGDENSGGFPER